MELQESASVVEIFSKDLSRQNNFHILDVKNK